MISIQPVKSKKDFNDFIKFPWKLYKDTPNWVPPLKYELKKRLNPQKASFFRRGKGALLLAKNGSEVVGRISVSIDKNNLEKSEGREGNFGCFEVIDDPDVTRALFDFGFDWLIKNGVTKVVGPIHFTLEDPYPGFLVEGFDEKPYFMMTYSMPYYADHMQKLGLETAMDLYTYEVSKERPVSDGMICKARETSKIEGLTLRNLNMKRLYDDAEIISDIFNEALRNNWGHVPFSKNYARRMARDLKLLADPRIVFIAEVKGRPVGAVINLPNHNELLGDLNGNLFPRGIMRILLKKKRIKSLRGYAIAVRDEFRGSGLASLMVKKSFEDGIKAGYEKGEITWILGSNKSMNNLAEFMSGNRNKTYRLYQRSLASFV